MRGIATIGFLAALASFQSQHAWAADCKLQLLHKVQMTRTSVGSDTIPVTVNGTPESFLFDTGGSLTQINRHVAEDLKLKISQGGIEMYDVNGNISRDMAEVKELVIAGMHGTDREMPISTGLGGAGIAGLDYLANLDLDIDFGTDKLNIFSPDHCEGQVVYWTDPASVGIVPIEVTSVFHIRVPVTLDGHAAHAIIDTGASYTALDVKEEERLFNLTLGAADTPERSTLNGDASLKTYTHRFQTLSVGDITVRNPEVVIIPHVAGRNADKAQLVGDRTKSEKDLVNFPDMIIGMNVLRKLHIYLAFKERKMYVSPASAPEAGSSGPQPTGAQP